MMTYGQKSYFEPNNQKHKSYSMMKKLSCILLASLFLITACKDDKGETDIGTGTETIDRNLDIYADWMTSAIVEKGDNVTLKNISIPRAHDAGTYVLTDCSIGGNACNTQTQDLDMTAMLKAGIRMYDIRPAWVNGDYYTQHVTECGGLGCQGDLISNMLEQTKNFLDNHSELVILTFGHWCDTGSDDADFMAMVNEKLGDRLFKDNGESSLGFMNRPLGNMFDIYEGKGKVIILFSDADDEPSLRANGIFNYSYLPQEGDYSNSYDFDYMSSDQIQKFNNYDSSSDAIFELSWTMTLDAGLSILCALNDSQSIEFYANQANVQLDSSMNELIEEGTIVKGKIPNIVSVDFADAFVTDVCLGLTKLNLD